jgi:hypothetical protein
MAKVALLFVILVLLTACVGSPLSGSDGDSADTTGVSRLVSDLMAAGGQARQAGAFDATPLQGQGTLLCLGAEELRVYTFANVRALEQAANSIDANDPSHVGTSIVEWMGNPRFWQRDNLLVLYVGTDVATERLLQRVLGPPFAKRTGVGISGPRLNACGSTSPAA